MITDHRRHVIGRGVNQLARYALDELEPVDAPDGAGASSDDDQVKYRVQRHASGGVTFIRTTPKLSKAERKAAKRARRR